LLRSLPEHERLSSLEAAALFGEIRDVLGGSTAELTLALETRMYFALRED
jgi:hypothetical protein